MVEPRGVEPLAFSLPMAEYKFNLSSIRIKTVALRSAPVAFLIILTAEGGKNGLSEGSQPYHFKLSWINAKLMKMAATTAERNSAAVDRCSND
jgi:hypothetical protein